MAQGVGAPAPNAEASGSIPTELSELCALPRGAVSYRALPRGPAVMCVCRVCGVTAAGAPVCKPRVAGDPCGRSFIVLLCVSGAAVCCPRWPAASPAAILDGVRCGRPGGHLVK